MDKLVSIISVYYNREKVIEESINSLINQTYKNIEIIIVDDGSSDNTYQELCKFDDKRLRIISHKNMGFVKSMQKAISISNGEYIAVHGSGDVSYPNRIEKQIEILENDRSIGIVSSLAIKTDLNNTYSRITNNKFDSRNGSYIEQLVDKSIIIHGASMYRKNIYNSVGGYREFFRFGQDRDLWLRMCTITKPYIIPEVLYTMYVLPDSVSDDFQKRITQLYFQSMSNQCIMLRIRGIEDYVDKYGFQAGFFRLRDKSLSKKLFRTGITEIYRDDLNNAKVALRMSINEHNSFTNYFLLGILNVIKEGSGSHKMLVSFIRRIKRNKY